MKFKKKEIIEFFHEVQKQERVLFSGILRSWGLIVFVFIFLISLIFFYSSKIFIFAHPDFLALVLIPPVLTWKGWTKICRANRFAGQIAVLTFTLKIWFFLLIIFRFVLTSFLAPYDFIDYQFWLRIFALLGLQLVVFGLMSKLNYFHTKPAFFFAVIYFPAALVFYAIENLNHLPLGIFTMGLLLVAYIFIKELTVKSYENIRY